jgi:hypothetical protein
MKQVCIRLIEILEEEIEKTPLNEYRIIVSIDSAIKQNNTYTNPST